MLHLSSWMTTLPMMLIGMVGILLVIGVIVLAVMLLNRLTSRDRKSTRLNSSHANESRMPSSA